MQQRIQQSQLHQIGKFLNLRTQSSSMWSIKQGIMIEQTLTQVVSTGMVI